MCIVCSNAVLYFGKTKRRQDPAKITHLQQRAGHCNVLAGVCPHTHLVKLAVVTLIVVFSCHQLFQFKFFLISPADVISFHEHSLYLVRVKCMTS